MEVTSQSIFIELQKKKAEKLTHISNDVCNANKTRPDARLPKSKVQSRLRVVRGSDKKRLTKHLGRSSYEDVKRDRQTHRQNDRQSHG